MEKVTRERFLPKLGAHPQARLQAVERKIEYIEARDANPNAQSFHSVLLCWIPISQAGEGGQHRGERAGVGDEQGRENDEERGEGDKLSTAVGRVRGVGDGACGVKGEVSFGAAGGRASTLTDDWLDEQPREWSCQPYETRALLGEPQAQQVRGTEAVEVPE